MLSEKLAASQAMLSERLAAQAAAKMAECCCEIRREISEDGGKTRALLNDQEHDRLRDRAAKAEQGLAAYFAAGKPPTVPVV